MNDVMDNITRLDDGRRTKFRHPAHRIMAARKLMHRSYHENSIQPDFSAEYEAIAAWSSVTCSYSGVEQAMKCLLQMQGTYIDKPLHKGGHRHHDIGKLFKDLAPEEQEVVRVSYRIYRSLHSYIPPETVDCFLDGIDEGYQAWRYFLLDGRKPEEWPKTHPGATLEIWSALTDIIQAKAYCNHGLHTVKTRIDFYFREMHVNAALKPGYQPNIEHINEIGPLASEKSIRGYQRLFPPYILPSERRASPHRPEIFCRTGGTYDNARINYVNSKRRTTQRR